MRSKVLAASFVLLSGYILAACGGGSSVPTGGGSGGAGGGVLNAAISGEPDQLDPSKTSSYNSFEVLENVYDTLVEPDQNLQMQPSLATKWTTSKDQLTWTFTLRDGVEFSDGTPLTSADVVYTYDRIIDDKLNSAYKFTTVKSISAPDPTTVVVRLKQPTPNLLSSLGGFKGMGIVEKENVTDGKIKTDPVGSGPFMVSKYTQGDSIRLVPNPHYWGPKPKISGIDFTFVKDPTVALQDLQSGQVQWTDNLPPQQVASLEQSSGGDTVVQSVPSTDYWYLTLNEARHPFDDVRVRQAVAYALDRDAITKAATYGTATANQTAIPKGSYWYDDYAPYSYDPTKAKSLLSQAGVSGLTMDLMVTSEYPQTVQAAQVIAAELKDVGIDVKIRTLDFAQWLDQEGKGQFDSFMLGWLGNLDPDEYYYAQQHSGASFNFQKFSNPKVDTLLDQARVETDKARRKELYDQAVKIIVDQASYIYLYNPDVVQGWSSSLQGYTVRPDRAIRFRDVSLSD